MNEGKPRDEHFMREALVLAKQAASMNEVPVGAVVEKDGIIIGRGANHPIGSCDPSAHAEVLALREAAQTSRNYRIPGATLYVTIEPCTMCLGAIMHARVSRLVFGANEPKAGVLQSNTALLEAGFFNHSLDWTGQVLERECSELISSFFAQRRALKAQLRASTGS